MTSLYNCHSEGDAYRITKFSAFGDVESSYVTTGQTCECPAGHRHTCRHRQMLPKFLDQGFVDTFYFYDFDRDGWVMNDLGQGVIPENETEIERDVRAEEWAEHEAEIEPLPRISRDEIDRMFGFTEPQPQAQPKPWRRV